MAYVGLADDGRMVAGFGHGLVSCVHTIGRLGTSMEGDGSVEISSPRSQGLVCGITCHEYSRYIGYSVPLRFLKKIQVRGEIVFSGLELF